MTNLGAVPVDPNTPVGLVRSLVGDGNYKDTSNPGEGDFNYFSDDELQAFLTVGMSNPYRAAGLALMQWSSVAANEARIITDVDLKADLTKRYDALAAQAKAFFELADKYDNSFDIVHTGKHFPDNRLQGDFLYPGGLMFPAGLVDYPGEFRGYSGWDYAW